MKALPLLRALALPAALIAAMPGASSAAIAAEALGRLFFTPEERQRLDRERQHPDEARARAGSTIVINGVVARSSGKRTIWVNGAAQHDGDTAGGVVVTTRREDPASISVATATPGPSGVAGRAKIRVGGSINLETAQAADLVAGGRIEARPRPERSQRR